MSLFGVGDPHSGFRVYIGNIPIYGDLPGLDHVRPLNEGEIAAIGQQCGNGWRKVFNCYAKLVFALQSSLHSDIAHYGRWQDWRDNCLLQEDSHSVLLFNQPDIQRLPDDSIHLVMGKGWAERCQLMPYVHWVTPEFAISTEHRVVVCPYFDYRQLSNHKIVFLCDLLRPMLGARGLAS